MPGNKRRGGMITQEEIQRRIQEQQERQSVQYQHHSIGGPSIQRQIRPGLEIV
jgi:hypothetical protein